MVASTPRPRMTVEEFAQITEDGKFDLVDGEVWYVSPTQILHGGLGPLVLTELVNHVRRVRAGKVYGTELGFRLSDERRTVLCPDAAFVVASRVPKGQRSGFFSGFPDLAVEIVSPSERPRQVQAKVSRYLEAGTTVVWCVYPELRQVVVYDAETDVPQILNATDSLTGGSILPGFELPLATLFEE